MKLFFLIISEMSADDINACLDKIYSINKYLGGTAYESDFRSKNVSIFKSLNNDFFKRFEEVKKIQNSRNDKRKEKDTSIEILRMNNKIKLGIEFMESIIQKMYDNLALLRKNGRETSEGDEIIFNCQDLLKKMKEVEFVHYKYSRKEEDNKNQKVLQKKGFSKKLLDFNVEEAVISDDDDNVAVKKKPKRDGPKVDKKAMNENIEKLKAEPLNDEEKVALELWKKKDQEIDKDLDLIEDEMNGILAQLDLFKDNMRKNEILVEYISEEVFKLSSELETTNAQMKIIIEKFKGPGRLCIDICMSLSLALLIGMLVYLIRRYISISGGSG